MIRRQPKRAQRGVRILTWLVPLGGFLSVINVTISLCSGEWLKSYERIPIERNGTAHKEEYRIKRTISGLWNLCYSDTSPELEMHCFQIDYFTKDRYTPDPHDSTMAIPFAVTRAGPLFILASILLGIGIIGATLGHLSRSKRIATFIAGIILIISGLIMLIGLVVYLSVLQSEIGPKLRSRNSLEAPLFSYYYGFGFILVVVGFMSTELTGIFSVFWYMYWHQVDWAAKAVNGVERSNTQEVPTTFFNISSTPAQQSHRHRSRNRHTESTPCSYHHHPNGHKKQRNWQYCDLHYPHLNNSHQRNCQLNSIHRQCKCDYSDDEYEFELPLPPPPPLSRDITTITNVSQDEFIHQDNKDRINNRKNTQV